MKQYNKLTYIESTRTQYIDTGVKPNQDIKIEIKCSLSSQYTNDACLLGVRDSTSGSNRTIIWFNNSNNAQLVFTLGNTTGDVLRTYPADTAYVFTLDNTGGYVDGNLVQSITTNSFSCTQNLALFGINTAGTVDSRRFYGKVYYCKIYDNNVLVRDFIPVLDSENVACLYDKVTDEFYYNQGTGSFSYGDYDYSDLIYDRTQEDVDYAIEHQGSPLFLKGSYNYIDLNRVEGWCEYISEQLNLYNYNVSITTKTDWSMDDFPTKSEMKRIKENVEKLKNAFIAFTDVPESLEKMTYQKANAIEKILYELNDLIESMIASFWYSGELFAGEV